MPRLCPECRGEILYNRDIKMYICTSCGRMYVKEELEELLEKRGEREAAKSRRSRRP